MARCAGALTFLCGPHPPNSDRERNATGLIGNLLSQVDEAGKLVADAGAVERVVEHLPRQLGLACRALGNIARSPEWSARAATVGVAALLESLGDEGGEDVGETLSALAEQEAVALSIVKDAALVGRIARRGWRGVLEQLCLHEAAASILAESETLWRLLDPFPKCQGLVSASDKGAERALADAPRLLLELANASEAKVLSNEASPVVDEERLKELAEIRSGYLLSLGNAARSNEAVAAILKLDNLFETLFPLLLGSVGDQHLASGLIGNIAVSELGRSVLGARGAAAAIAQCFCKSANAHVMMNCAVVLRRMALAPDLRQLVATELGPVMEQRDRLNQPEHQRIAFESARVLALCCGEPSVELGERGELLLSDLLDAEWGVLKVEACRGCALLASKCPVPLVEKMVRYFADSKADGQLRVAAAIAVSHCDPQNAAFQDALQVVAKDSETEVEGRKLSDLASKLIIIKPE